MNFNKLLDSYWEDLFSLVPEIEQYSDKMYIAGGAIVSAIHGDRPKDIDIYFEDEKTRDSVLELYKVKRLGKQTKYAVTLNAAFTYQFITLRTGLAVDVLNNFDFIHTMASFKYGDDIFYGDDRTYACISKKHLVLSNSINYAFTYSRMFRFLGRGYVVKGNWSNDLLRGIYQESEVADCLLSESIPDCGGESC